MAPGHARHDCLKCDARGGEVSAWKLCGRLLVCEKEREPFETGFVSFDLLAQIRVAKTKENEILRQATLLEQLNQRYGRPLKQHAVGAMREEAVSADNSRELGDLTRAGGMGWEKVKPFTNLLRCVETVERAKVEVFRYRWSELTARSAGWSAGHQSCQYDATYRWLKRRCNIASFGWNDGGG